MPSQPDARSPQLLFDLATLRSQERRAMLRLLAGLSLVQLLGCGGSKGDSATDFRAAAPGGAGPGPVGGAGVVRDCTETPSETGGPYPGDGSNGPNALKTSGVVRSDLRPSFGALTGTAAGVPLTIRLKLVDATGCAILAGYAVYLWHCDKDGEYSMYDLADRNYLRGVQQADVAGEVTFTTTFPGAYSGRWPHMHFEVFSSLEAATAAGSKVKTSQLALPRATCELVYASHGYETSARNLADLDLDGDNVFRDGVDEQMAAISGDLSTGLTAILTVGVPA